MGRRHDYVLPLSRLELPPEELTFEASDATCNHVLSLVFHLLGVLLYFSGGGGAPPAPTPGRISSGGVPEATPTVPLTVRCRKSRKMTDFGEEAKISRRECQFQGVQRRREHEQIAADNEHKSQTGKCNKFARHSLSTG